MQEISDRALSQITSLIRVTEKNEPYVDVLGLSVAAGLQHDEVSQYAHLANVESHGGRRVEMYLSPEEAGPFQVAYTYYINSEAALHLANSLQPSTLRVLLYMLHGYMQSYYQKTAA